MGQMPVKGRLFYRVKKVLKASCIIMQDQCECTQLLHYSLSLCFPAMLWCGLIFIRQTSTAEDEIPQCWHFLKPTYLVSEAPRIP